MKLLVIDDEKDILILIKRALSSDYEVTTVHRPFEDVPENLADYDLLIADVMMPGEDGYSLLTRIRDKTDAPIIFLSAKALEEDIIYGLSIGADDYIRKPFAVAELRARVAAHIRRDKRDRSACIKDGSISIYPDSRLVQVDGKELSLTKSEFDIAMLLLRNKGQVFSKEQINEKIYGFDKDGDESAVTEHIKNLRRKLSDAGNVIETVWGIGYRSPISTGIYELDQINVATDGMQKELVATMEDKWKKEQDSKAQMAQIAHDLKTPLAVIRGNADLLMEKDCDEESKESLDAIIRNSEKIALSVLDILEK